TRFSRDWSSDVCSSDLNDPEYQEQLSKQQREAELLQEMKEREANRFSVQKASMTKGIFNTIKAKDSESFIKAIVDEDITVYAGRSEERRVGKECRARWS